MGFKFRAPKISAPKVDSRSPLNVAKNIGGGLVGGPIGLLGGTKLDSSNSSRGVDLAGNLGLGGFGMLGQKIFDMTNSQALGLSKKPGGVPGPNLPGLPDRGDVASDVMDEERRGLMRKRASQTLFTGGQGVTSVPTASAVLLGF